MTSVAGRAITPFAFNVQSIIAKAVSPVLGLMLFLFIWHIGAGSIETSLGKFPGPVEVHTQAQALYSEHVEQRAKQEKFYERQNARIEKKIAKNPDAVVKVRTYTGKPSYLDQIFTSIYTVLAGFLLATFIAVPLGILCGLSDGMYRAINPIIQIFKPVSPLAWLPLVTMVVSALYVTEDPLFEKSFLNSALTVTLCCLWPTVINTTVGVSAIDRDLVDVSRVIKLGALSHIKNVVLPSSIPMIFTGLRLSLATGWMVLIAAEMLAQNPGLGKFIWDEFQNGSSSSLSRIMVAVITIGAIGFLLDRLMLAIQGRVSWDKQAVLR